MVKPPTNVVASISADKLTVTWVKSLSSDVVKYKAHLHLNNGDKEYQGVDTPATTTTYTWTLPPKGTKEQCWTVNIRAYNNHGDKSDVARSNKVCQTTLPPSPPPVVCPDYKIACPTGQHIVQPDTKDSSGCPVSPVCVPDIPNCSPNWICETANGQYTGYEVDGCGHRRQPAQANQCNPVNPPPPGEKNITITGILDQSPEHCYMVMALEDGKQYDLYGLGNRAPKLQTHVKVTGYITQGQLGCTKGIQLQVVTIEEVCQPLWQCKAPGYEEDGCGNTRANAKCMSPQCQSDTNWTCDQPLNGMEQDDCGQRRKNAKCEQPTQPAPGNGDIGQVLTEGDTTGYVQKAGTILGINPVYIGYGVIIVLLVIMLKITKVIH